jgi:SAM-dependent methyltransferase
LDPDVARGRVRRRQGSFVVHNGVPVPDPETTFALIHGELIGNWLHRNEKYVQGDLLDVGCGNQPYRPWYQPLVQSVVGVDVTGPDSLSARAYAECLPFSGSTFDTVLMTEVLEHVGNAAAAVNEAARVLRSGGHLLVTVPFLYPTHEAPYDFHRFTHYGLVDTLQRAPLEVITVDAKGGVGVLAAHYATLGLRLGLMSARREDGSSLLDRRWGQVLVTRPQRLITPFLRGRRGVSGLAEYVSLGYMAVARKGTAAANGP